MIRGISSYCITFIPAFGIRIRRGHFEESRGISHRFLCAFAMFRGFCFECFQSFFGPARAAFFLFLFDLRGEIKMVMSETEV